MKMIMKMVTMIIPRLPCIVDRLEGFVMLWKKNGEIITVASQIIDKVVIIIMMNDHGDHDIVVINHGDNYDDHNDAGDEK